MANGLERREFLKVLGVSGAGATLAGCSTGTSPEKLIPYVVPDEQIVPGISTWYRTTCSECPAGCGMNVRTREGRAIKADGNPLSPISHGKLCARGQASLHGLYNPDRIPQAFARDGGSLQPLGWDDAEQRLADALARSRGRTVFLTEGLTGSMDALIDEFCAAFGIERVRFEPFALEPVRTANRLLFGIDALPVHDFSQADVVLNFGADFMETWLSPIDYAHGFVQSHSYDRGRRGTLIAVTPHQSLTDMNADEWLAVEPGTEHLAALAIARLIVDAGASAGGAASLLGTVDVDANAQAAGVPAGTLRDVAARFANGGRSLAVGPGIGSSHGSATAVAAAVAILNSVAGNIGRTVHLDRHERGGAAAGSYNAMKDLVARMGRNEIGALLVYGPNPAYSLASDDNAAQALANVPFIASFSSYPDETSEHAHLLLPDHHFLESWGDGVPRTGVRSLVQPVMLPVFDTKQTGDVLLSVARRANASLAAGAATFYDYLRGRWARDVYSASNGSSFEDWWIDTLKTGFVANVAAAGTAPAISADGLSQIGFARPAFDGDAADPVLIVYPSYKYYDGRLANRPWLQELPDPVSKFCWSSWVELHPDRADSLGLDTGHIVEVGVGARTATVPVWRNPAMREDVIAMQLGQGHSGLGTYAAGRGANAMQLLTGTVEAASGALVWQQTRATIRATGRWERPIKAGLQDEQHNREIAQGQTLAEATAADAGRGLTLIAGAGVVAAATPAEQAGGHGEEQVHPLDARVTELQGAGGFRPETFSASPAAGYPPPGTWYGEYSMAQPRWGMVIDLEKCIGCSACTTACYAENNIGIVGPKLVAQGRILQWIRIERYFEQEAESLHTTFLPMLCQHCGNAPCEPVCPVYASYHTPDGLNAQVYNRCVGTRYCANNCPYKVRNFNYFSYEWPSPLNWQLNPDVTVREKGVMEKCSMCVQRIREAENNARVEDRGVHDGEIVPACAQTCPGDAIVFGNLRDPQSRVAQAATSGRGYRVLEELNTQSAITYLRKIVAEA
jgi:anaerobic selenocysteine-containing dehydrogenase/Fe-S-cluster-containing dehydrogenase component